MFKSYYEDPYLINFDTYGSDSEGFLFTTQLAEKLPFAIKRVFWVKNVPENHIRGQHAGYKTQELIVCINGELTIATETANSKNTFVLNKPNKGLYIPPLCWVKINFSENAMLLCMASTDFDPADYINEYNKFHELIGR